MEYITIQYEIESELVDNPSNETLFTLKVLENIKEVYDRILEKLTPFDIVVERNKKGLNQVTIKVKYRISERNSDPNFDIDDLINKALKS